jgi:hypothetical protein
MAESRSGVQARAIQGNTDHRRTYVSAFMIHSGKREQQPQFRTW